MNIFCAASLYTLVSAGKIYVTPFIYNPVVKAAAKSRQFFRHS
jgi:hypothetical protein